MTDNISFINLDGEGCYEHEQGGDVKEMEHCIYCYTSLQRITLEPDADQPDLFTVKLEEREIDGRFDNPDLIPVKPHSTFLLKVNDETTVTDEELSAFQPHLPLLQSLFGVKEMVDQLKTKISRDKALCQKLTRGNKSKASQTSFDRDKYKADVEAIRAKFIPNLWRYGYSSSHKASTAQQQQKFQIKDPRKRLEAKLLSILADVVILSELELLLSDPDAQQKPNPHVRPRGKAAAAAASAAGSSSWVVAICATDN